VPAGSVKAIMHKLLIAALLSCQPGDRLVDWSGRFPSGTHVAAMLVTVSPFYTRLSIYQPGHPDVIHRCCNDKPASVIRMPISDGKFCIGQSQPQMKWTLKLTLERGEEI
jgi:hypothetical protein